MFAEIIESIRLSLIHILLYAPDYGVPQSRERVIFFGFKKSAMTEDAKKALTQTVIPEQYLSLIHI